ncbi:MAG: hypothetical protein ACK2T6_08520 [Anaerolineae bacterium]
MPGEVEYKAAWLSWVAAATGCLDALGADVDLVEVAGTCGYAFHLCVHDELCVSGPTVFDWEQLEWGVRMLGRSVLRFGSGECHGDPSNEARRADHARVSFDIARREVEAGRPCVLWGAYVPEFAIVVGIEGDSYLVESFKGLHGEDQPPIPYADVEAPGGDYLLAFPTPTEFARETADKHALRNAVLMFDRQWLGQRYRWGAEAYDLWIESLTASRANAWGNSYNAQCYAEGRRQAHEFLARLAARNEDVADEMAPAVAAYATAASAMGRLAELFPFDMSDFEAVVDDDQAITEAVEALEVAREAEVLAIDIIEQVVSGPWGGQG